MNKHIQFTKSEGAGNDFIIIDNLAGDIDLSPDEVAFLCDRHFGIGADGLILAESSGDKAGDFFMKFFNSDGSVAEMCGNGIRCFAKYLYDNCLLNMDTFSISTLAGLKSVALISENSEVNMVKVDMGRFSFKSANVPILIEGDEFIDQTIDVQGQKMKFTSLSMGNPHTVTFVGDIETAPVSTVGPFIENHPIFPKKTNVEFAEVVSDSKLKLRVWERGVGETLACGTGASAAALVANRLGLTGKKVKVELLGGDLETEILNDNILMTGPANRVFTGQIILKMEEKT
ncbi:MAG: diaminopimelate epimerase [Actinomycetota bacterium]|nr:diaminopimelate epimerase [Actinomycetota bacterium]